MPKYAYHQVDPNQKQMVVKLRAMGYSVAPIAQHADLLVGYAGLTLVVEVKDATKPPSAHGHALTEKEQKFKDSWKGSYIIAYDTEDVTKWFRQRIVSAPVGTLKA